MRKLFIIIALAALLPGLWLSMVLLRRRATLLRRVLGAAFYVMTAIVLMELILAQLHPQRGYAAAR